MDIITRAEAKKQGLKRYFTGKPCKRGHVYERLISNYECIKCARQRQKNNRDKRAEYHKRWYRENRNKKAEKHQEYYRNNRDKIADQQKEYRANNRKKLIEYQKKYRADHPDRVAASMRAWYDRGGKQHARRYAREKRRTDPGFRLRCVLRARLNCAIKGNSKSGSAVRDLGCSIEELKSHLESQFQPGMTWENWSRDGWHIDHIQPLASFDLTDRQQLKEACNYQNLQPLWAADNLSKSAKEVTP